MKCFQVLTVCVVASALVACSGDGEKSPERGVFPAERTFAVFNPIVSALPVPNDLLFAREPAGDGTMNAGSDPANPVISGIDALDGNSLLAPFDVRFSGSLYADQTLDARSYIESEGLVIPNPNQNVFLLPLTYPSGDALLSAEADLDNDGTAERVEVPTFSDALAYTASLTAAAIDAASLSSIVQPTVRAELISLDGGINNTVRITPLRPLLPKTKYLVVVTNILDAQGNSVFPSRAYETIRDPESNLAGVSPALAALRPNVRAWEQLASGYFDFKRRVYEQLSLSYSAPSSDDILMSITFTTTGTYEVLSSIAAPELFFKSSIESAYKKDAIVKVVSGVYGLDGNSIGTSDATDMAINQTLAFLLSSPTLPNTATNPLYQVGIAQAIAAGADYATLASENATAAFVIQSAAAQAALQVHNSADAMQGDVEPYVDIATEAVGTVMALSQNNPAALFPIPMARPNRFFRVDAASDINAALAAPAMVYQGEISLPQYMSNPSDTGVELMTDRWTASSTIGGAIDIGQGNTAGSTPRSDKTTYRYPFPTQKDSATVPIVAMLPHEPTLANFGITKPEDGWPVVIYIHGITRDRSGALPVANALSFACIQPDLSGVTGAPCFATIAIDQPQHGLAAEGATVPGLYDANDPNSVLTPNLPISDPMAPSDALTERHFGFTANAAVQPMPMVYDNSNPVGRSGSLFINLSQFENARDKLRQMTVDLMNVNASIATMDVDGDGMAGDLDANRVYVIGNSLGAINGIPFVAVNNLEAVQSSLFTALPEVRAAAMLNTGGGLPRLLTNSVARAPQILQGLAAASPELQQGNSALESYLSVFQGVLDSIDPMNFAPLLSDANDDTGILLTEIIGDGTSAQPSDSTIPNAADSRWGDRYGPLMMTLDNGFEINGFPAPLAGTEPLVAQFGAIKTAEVQDDGDANVLVTRFVEGSHGNIVSAGNEAAEPFSSAAVFAEMVAQITTFFAADGDVGSSIVRNPDVVEN